MKLEKKRLLKNLTLEIHNTKTDQKGSIPYINANLKIILKKNLAIEIN